MQGFPRIKVMAARQSKGLLGGAFDDDAAGFSGLIGSPENAKS